MSRALALRFATEAALMLALWPLPSGIRGQSKLLPLQPSFRQSISLVAGRRHIRSDFVVNKYSLTDQGYGLRCVRTPKCLLPAEVAVFDLPKGFKGFVRLFSSGSPAIAARLGNASTELVSKTPLRCRRDNNVTLVLNWNTVPSTGLLTLHHAFSDVFKFQVPEVYS